MAWAWESDVCLPEHVDGNTLFPAIQEGNPETITTL